VIRIDHKVVGVRRFALYRKRQKPEHIEKQTKQNQSKRTQTLDVNRGYEISPAVLRKVQESKSKQRQQALNVNCGYEISPAAQLLLLFA